MDILKRGMITGVAMLLMAGCAQKKEVTDSASQQPPAEAEIVMLQPVEIPTAFKWEETGKDERTVSRVDTQNGARQKNGRLHFWSRVDHKQPLNLGPYKNIATELHLNDVDCQTGLATFSYWVALDAKGKQLTAKHMGVVSEKAPEAGSPEAAAHKKVCGAG